MHFRNRPLKETLYAFHHPYSFFQASHINASEEETQIIYNRQSLGIPGVFYIIKPSVNFTNYTVCIGFSRMY